MDLVSYPARAEGLGKYVYVNINQVILLYKFIVIVK